MIVNIFYIISKKQNLNQAVVDKLLTCLKDLKRKRALVVHGEDGLDEVSVCSATYVSKLENDKNLYYLTSRLWRPEYEKSNQGFY